jgi:hypothetical protein
MNTVEGKEQLFGLSVCLIIRSFFESFHMTTPYLLGHLQNTACSVMRTQLLLFVLSDGNTTKNE